MEQLAVCPGANFVNWLSSCQRCSTYQIPATAGFRRHVRTGQGQRKLSEEHICRCQSRKRKSRRSRPQQYRPHLGLVCHPVSIRAQEGITPRRLVVVNSYSPFVFFAHRTRLSECLEHLGGITSAIGASSKGRSGRTVTELSA